MLLCCLQCPLNDCTGGMVPPMASTAINMTIDYVLRAWRMQRARVAKICLETKSHRPSFSSKMLIHNKRVGYASSATAMTCRPR